MALTRKRSTTVITVETRLERETSVAPDNQSGSTTTISTTVREGPIALLKTEYDAAITAVARAGQSLSARLSPTSAGQGRLELVTKSTSQWQTSSGGGGPDPEPEDPPPPPDNVIEIEWVELRRAIENHPRYASLTTKEIAEARAHAEDPVKNPLPSSSFAAELAVKLARGQTEYSIAAPVVRSTTYHARNSFPPTQAYIRSSPPVSPSGPWQWLKTADRVVKQGKWITRTQEWTGAQTWDPQIYT